MQMRGVPIPKFGARNLLFAKIYVENCMKMKEIGQGGVTCP